MADTVRIYWTTTNDHETGELLYRAHIKVAGMNGGTLFVYPATQKEEFFRRYNTLTVTKEPAPQEVG